MKQEDIKCENCIWWEKASVGYEDSYGGCSYLPITIMKKGDGLCSQWNARPPHQDFFKLLCTIAYELREQNDDDDDSENKSDNSVTFVNVEGMPFL